MPAAEPGGRGDWGSIFTPLRFNGGSETHMKRTNPRSSSHCHCQKTVSCPTYSFRQWIVDIQSHFLMATQPDNRQMLLDRITLSILRHCFVILRKTLPWRCVLTRYHRLSPHADCEVPQGRYLRPYIFKARRTDRVITVEEVLSYQPNVSWNRLGDSALGPGSIPYTRKQEWKTKSWIQTQGQICHPCHKNYRHVSKSFCFLTHFDLSSCIILQTKAMHFHFSPQEKVRFLGCIWPFLFADRIMERFGCISLKGFLKFYQASQSSNIYFNKNF